MVYRTNRKFAFEFSSAGVNLLSFILSFDFTQFLFAYIYCRVILCKLCRHFKPTLQLCSYCCHCLCCQYYFLLYKKTTDHSRIIYISIKGCHTDLNKYSSHLLSEAKIPETKRCFKGIGL